MEELMREEIVETTADVAENAVESVATADSSFGKAAVIVGGVVLVGFGVYKLAKYIKAKKAEKNTDECYADDVESEILDSDDEDFDR